MLITSILGTSILLQWTAAVLAMRLFKITGRPWAWVLIAAALVLMTLRRGISWFRLLSGDLTSPPDMAAELVALAISIFMVTGVAGIASLFHAMRRSEQTLQESEARFRTVTEAALAGVYIIQGDLFRYVNPAFAQIFGYHPEEVIDKLRPQDLVHPDDRDLVDSNIRRRLDGETERLQYTLRGLRKDGRIIQCDVLGRSAIHEGRPAIIGTLVDNTERLRAERQLMYEAFHDALTGLPNRALFVDRLGRALVRAHRHAQYRYAVLFLDLDDFKKIHDSLGHAAGDQLLVEIADRLEWVIRPSDTLARLGGDEFAILLDNLEDVSDASRVATRVQNELAMPFDLNTNPVYASASIGIAFSGTGYTHAGDLLRDADLAMYRAKEQGRGCYEIFDVEMHRRAVARLQLETELRKAVELQEFRVHYQPIVSLDSGAIIGFEALVRWQEPDRGLLSPADFIGVAEETGLIISIDQWVLSEASHRVRDWQRQYLERADLALSVNLSSKHFMQPDLVEQIGQILVETGLEAQALRLELTESVIMEDVELAISTLHGLKAMGVQLQVDDFGTGFSSLNYLHRFPIDTLKIDRSFVHGMCCDRNNEQIVETIISLAQGMGKDVIAEGVEREEEREKLRALGCEYAQGYLFSRPVDVQGAEMLISAADDSGDPWRQRAGAG